jgi:hypothetical protein
MNTSYLNDMSRALRAAVDDSHYIRSSDAVNGNEVMDR